MLPKTLQVLLIVCMSAAAAAQDTVAFIRLQPDTLQIDKPGKWRFITHVPADLLQIAKSPIRKTNWKGTALVLASTALLLPLDQRITDGVKDASRQIHLHPETDYHVVLRVGDTKVIKLPRNINTALYQLGQGSTSMLISGGLFIYGKLNSDKRALQTAGDLAETFITMGITTQVLKRISGRQSPFMSTQSGGAWHPFPSFKEYQLNTSNYDAFPSGHLATMMATTTVLTTNYPEKKWIGILGYTLTGLTAWAMINTEVHWISDYPLALALGYVSGKITCLRHKKSTHKLTNY